MRMRLCTQGRKNSQTLDLEMTRRWDEDGNRGQRKIVITFQQSLMYVSKVLGYDIIQTQFTRI